MYTILRILLKQIQEITINTFFFDFIYYVDGLRDHSGNFATHKTCEYSGNFETQKTCKHLISHQKLGRVE